MESFVESGKHPPSAFPPSGAAPLATSPFSFKSMCQLSVSPALFFSVKAKTALPCLTASLRSVGEDWRESLIASNPAEEGKASVGEKLSISEVLKGKVQTEA